VIADQLAMVQEINFDQSFGYQPPNPPRFEFAFVVENIYVAL
jgi:hypothetical protein